MVFLSKTVKRNSIYCGIQVLCFACRPLLCMQKAPGSFSSLSRLSSRWCLLPEALVCAGLCRQCWPQWTYGMRNLFWVPHSSRAAFHGDQWTAEEEENRKGFILPLENLNSKYLIFNTDIKKVFLCLRCMQAAASQYRQHWTSWNNVWKAVKQLINLARMFIFSVGCKLLI